MRPETEAAIRAAEIAQRLADSRAGADQVTSKGGIDLVTATDLACEDAIRAELTRAFPAYAVIGEERSGSPAPGAPYWLVDPICGTRPFASHVPLYCSNIALVEHGAVTVAAIGVGHTGEILYAERGLGAWMRTAAGERRLVPGEHSDTIWFGGSTEQAATVVRNALVFQRWYVWLFSSSVAYAYLAAGRVAGIAHFEVSSPIHTAAGCFVAEEAGAVVTGLAAGGPWTFETRSLLLAATPALHRELWDLVERSR
ncbi:MAG TPA: inositol monophosphatase [Candidatus Binatia bacterium]|nr:inositol monophosphatase [Candidatus Binatia bacterium]